ncbi:MAG: hypothetical protein GTO45_34315 [Candidatus Aminicenantes bacterium]|nr:hypothetical protein [Candidatus Aminicenantes bacterium]NIM83783.1 hypothetical protein [Candidatus Aminicenantes bacterium]NIN23243.1 hypothetical protein [Candidatus Aminicenantes bacterium]NIN46937.1 hypothetical protein [Candidatus Aminicenantes bacterium]NIN89859.1 hypothetical protein [Candidatus Aminicenantes bacterium]
MLNKLKPFIITICIFFQLVMFFSCKVGDSQSPVLTEEQQQLIRELNGWLFPLTASPLELTDKELSFLDQLSFAKIVALGEATHGTREFFQMKHRVFQYLVEHLNHKAFGFEADFAECLYLNNYVTKGEGDLLELINTKMLFWTWRTEAVKELLEWMKNYNTGKSDEEKIHYFGFDCQALTYQPDLIHTYLQPLLPTLWETASPILSQVQDFSEDDYIGLSEEDYNTIKTQLASLEDQLTANKDQLVANSSLKEYEICKQLFRTFGQAFIVRYTHYHKNNVKINWRDRFMAENALWIADFLGEDARITLWAHDGHIAKAYRYGEKGPFGYHLHKNLGDLYQAVGFGFSRGSFTAVGVGNLLWELTHTIIDEPNPTSVNFLFHRAFYPNFAFNLDAIPPGSAWDSWLSELRLFLLIGALYDGIPDKYYWLTDLSRDFNWIIYFDTTNASILILPSS